MELGMHPHVREEKQEINTLGFTYIQSVKIIC